MADEKLLSFHRYEVDNGSSQGKGGGDHGDYLNGVNLLWTVVTS